MRLEVSAAVQRVSAMVRLPTLSTVVQPGPRPISGPPRVSDTLVCGRSRRTAIDEVQKFAQVTVVVPRT